jgi:outer membrane protein
MKKILALALTVCICTTAQAEDLLEAYNLAKSSDPQLKLAANQAKSTAEGVVQARARLLPQVSADASYERSESESTRLQFDRTSNGTLVQFPTTSDGDNTNKRFGLTIDQTIYNHSNYTQLGGARVNVERAEAELAAARMQLMIRVSEAYFNLLTAKDSLATSEAEEKAVGRQLEQAEQRFNVGLTAITDVHEARARFDSAKAAKILSENSVDDARLALSEITGSFVEDVVALAENLPLDRPDGEWQAWVDLAMKNNPDLQAVMLSADSADWQIQTARAGHYPTLSAYGSYADTTDSGSSTTVFPGGTNNFPSDSDFNNSAIGIRLNVPLFSGYATSSRVQQAVYDHDAALDRVESQRRAIMRQTRNAYRTVLAGISEVQARKQALVSATSALEATQAGFEVGTRTIVDVLISQQVLFQAQRDYSNARHNFVVNGLRLKRAAGTVAESDLERINGLLKK